MVPAEVKTEVRAAPEPELRRSARIAAKPRVNLSEVVGGVGDFPDCVKIDKPLSIPPENLARGEVESVVASIPKGV